VTEGIHAGTYNFGIVHATALGMYMPELRVFDFPFLFKSWDHFWNAVSPDSPVAQEMLAELENYGFKAFMFGLAGTFNTTNIQHPIRVPEDIKGLKMRTLDTPIQLGTMEALGATAVFINVAEAYTALQQHTIDGTISMWFGHRSLKYYEIVKYITEDSLFYIPHIVVMNLDFWNSLSAEDQAAIEEAVLSTFEFHKENQAQAHKELLQWLVDNGCEAVYADELDYDTWRAAVQPVYDKYSNEYGDWVDRINAITQ
jgi:TRAP-type C4-dicarboxylate transport system substrate-binding protein